MAKFNVAFLFAFVLGFLQRQKRLGLSNLGDARALSRQMTSHNNCRDSRALL
jgi:hypothetical protein